MLRLDTMPVIALVCTLGLAATVGCAHGARDWYALVVVPPKANGALPVIASLDWALIAKAEGRGFAGPVERGKVAAEVEGPGGKLTPVPVQYDPESPTKGSLAMLLPASTEEQRVRLYAGEESAALATTAATPLRIDVAHGVATVDNGYAAYTFDPARQGGLPSKIVFGASGKVFDALNDNDAVYEKSVGRLQLNHCPEAKVRVTAAGPLRAVVRVEGYYCDEKGVRPETKPQAVYEYSFLPGSPIVLLRALVTQERGFAWSELHIAELHTAGADWTRMAVAGQTQDLKADSKGASGAGWGALLDSGKPPSVLGIVAPSVAIHDGRGAYGTYVHGPWAPWSGTEARFTVGIYAAAGDDALDRLAAAAKSLPQEQNAVVSVPQLEDALAATGQAGSGVDKLRWRWVASILRTQSREDLIGATALAQSARKAAQAGGKSEEWIAKNAPEWVLIDDGRIGMAWRMGKDKSARLMGIFDLVAGRTLSGGGAPQPLWKASLDGGQRGEIVVDAHEPLRNWKPMKPRKGVTMDWSPLRTVKGVAESDRELLTITVEIIAEDGQLKLTMKLHNKTSMSLTDTTWPQLYFGPLGGTGTDDVFVGGFCSGVMWKDPYSNGAGSGGMYPNGWNDMPIYMIYDKQGGLVMMAEDPLGSDKYTESGLDGATQSMRLSFRWPAEDETLAGNSFAPPGRVTVAALGAGQDWYDAGMIYRAWAEKEAQWWPQRGKAGRPDTPAWMRDIPIWAQINGTKDEAVPGAKAMREYLGVPMAVHWYSWHEIPFDVHYPDYFPAKPGFAEGVKELQDAGIRVMPYINGRLWDTQNEDFQTTGKPACTKDKKGNPYIEEYGSGAKLAPMCPATKVWQDKVQEIVKRLVGPEFNVDGVYIDQVAAAGAVLCYDNTHGHPLGGGHWWTTMGYWPMLTKLRADLARDYPAGKFLTTECSAEPYLQCFDGYLAWHWQENNAVPLMPAIYGDKIRFFSRSYGAAGDTALVHRMKMGQQLVFGESLGWLDTGLIKEAKFGPFMRDCAQTRWKLRDCFRGRMQKPPTVEGTVDEVTGDWQWGGVRMVTMSAVQAGAFKAEDGRVAVVVLNVSEKPQEFDLVMPVKEWGVKGEATMHVTLAGMEVRSFELRP